MKISAKENFDVCKKMIKDKQYQPGFSLLCSTIKPMDDFSLQHQCARLFKSIPSNELKINPLKIAILASSSVEHFSEILMFWLAQEGIDAQIFLAEFNTIDQSLLDPSGKLYQFQPDLIWLFTNGKDIQSEIHLTQNERELDQYLYNELGKFKNRWQILQKYSVKNLSLRCFL